MRNATTMVAALAVCMVSAAWMPEVYAKDKKPKAKPKAKAENCVRLVETRIDDDTLGFELVNKCKAERECTIKWAVTCDGSTPQEEEKNADLAAGASETWPASAKHCGDAGYVISPPKYYCRVPTMDTAKAE
jgi:hypothetical protein